LSVFQVRLGVAVVTARTAPWYAPGARSLLAFACLKPKRRSCEVQVDFGPIPGGGASRVR